jgi:hypothetical protein
MAGQVSYSYNSKSQTFATQAEHYDKDFQMDTAFYKRTGVTENWTYYSRYFYPDEDRYPWFKKFGPFVWVHTGQDRIQGGSEYFALGGFRMNFTRQGSFRLDFGNGREPWAGRMFKTNQIQAMGGAQLFSWLNFYSYFNRGRSIYYDPVDPFPGTSLNFHLDGTLQPSQKLNQYLSYDRVLFNRLSDGTRVYTVDIFNTKTTYQFNRHFFVRAIERYDSSRNQVMMDFLASYEPVPGTVAYAGYGNLIERGEWDGSKLNVGPGNYLGTHRSIFFKFSYLYRF